MEAESDSIGAASECPDMLCFAIHAQLGYSMFLWLQEESDGCRRISEREKKKKKELRSLTDEF